MSSAPLARQVSVARNVMSYPLSHLSLFAARGGELIGAFAFNFKFAIVSFNSGVLRLDDGLGNVRDACLVAP